MSVAWYQHVEEVIAGAAWQQGEEVLALLATAATRLAALRALHWETADQACVECGQEWPCKTIRIVTGQP